MYYDVTQALVIGFFAYLGIVTAGGLLLNKYRPAILEKHALAFAMLLIAPVNVIYQLLTLIGSIIIAGIFIFIEINDDNILILILGSCLAYAVDNSISLSINTSQAANYKKMRKKYVPEFMMAFAVLMLFEGSLNGFGVTALIFIIGTFAEYFVSKEEFKPFNEVKAFIQKLRDASRSKESEKLIFLLKPIALKILRIICISIVIYLISIIEIGIVTCLVLVCIYIAIAVSYYKGVKAEKDNIS